MELPTALRQAVDAALEGALLTELAAASTELSRRYRAEIRDGRFHVLDELAAKAYLATRLPATYAAARAALGVVADEHPDFTPQTLLDVGAGPGTLLWAAADCWPSLREATLVEGSPVMRGYGERFAASLDVATTWEARNFSAALGAAGTFDLVTLSFVLDELDDTQRDRLVAELWRHTARVLVIVEPGRPAGWQRILRARDRLLEAGAHIVAPCPHTSECPIKEPDWCHFAERLPRSRIHRLAKGGDAPYEDEKYSYVAVSRAPMHLPKARILSSPRAGSGKVALKLCESDGEARERLVTRREGETYKSARRKSWGNALDL
ncbi:mitochondrial small ribosomal subunit Rsm22 [Variibacter gotjawalensis]|uniref:Mitochondrial small ribosomal subunit Rsm22 n=1 Tax=Variibacter gotjawalensis TaxID=1333996 RepID=A0A0S3PR80_9BRAD|nr:small ribosomal subunit Rsm22 family protein [Variibacter gotjawalensis]NIK48761.1 ribosomal protein RSM22 (predicted rRNA methylase) [Variibacter gotjawalensis]RZS50622.1 ribosomal protein RSM22 (predicted rRNA methylase) [Variibacter gotjawalensis]BAT58456.1 mitochondrial small ribosomal subunit Rsm22 [Variibacter gotjawalensis]